MEYVLVHFIHGPVAHVSWECTASLHGATKQRAKVFVQMSQEEAIRG
jgi:hypothetical protein